MQLHPNEIFINLLQKYIKICKTQTTVIAIILFFSITSDYQCVINLYSKRIKVFTNSEESKDKDDAASDENNQNKDESADENEETKLPSDLDNVSYDIVIPNVN